MTREAVLEILEAARQGRESYGISGRDPVHAGPVDADPHVAGTPEAHATVRSS